MVLGTSTVHPTVHLSLLHTPNFAVSLRRVHFFKLIIIFIPTTTTSSLPPPTMATTTAATTDHPIDIPMDDGSPLDQQTQENYRIWKKNTPFLYDYISTYTLLWPSMTVQFFPDLENPGIKPMDPLHHDNESNRPQHDILYQRLLLGSFTSGQAVDKISILQLPYYEDLNKHLNVDKLNYNNDKLEFELTTVSKRKVSTLQKINHQGDVNKLLYMPQNPDVIASGNNYGELVIYDRTKHSTYKNNDDIEIDDPELRLGTSESDNEVSDNNEIFALDWNKQQEGMIISGNMKGEINLYDIKSQFKSKSDKLISPLQRFNSDTFGINDITWVPDHDSIFTAVDEGGYFKMYDIRISNDNKGMIINQQLSTTAINSVSMNPVNLMFTAIGDNDGNLQIWDIRNIKNQQQQQTSIFNLPKIHQDSITRVKWHPKYHNVLGSCSNDKQVKLYDLDNSYHNEDPLMFIHGGHMLGVNDFDWSLHEDWMISSVADDNALHIWKPSHEIVRKYHQP